MSALEKLGGYLTSAIQKIVRSSVVDEATVKELIKDIQRALLQADVNVHLVIDLTKTIEERSLKEKLPPGISRKEHIVKVVYEELTKFLGEKPAKISLKPGKSNVIMLVGMQGSGKTTSAAKMARYFQKRGLKVALICADTFRLGAYPQLKQLADRINVPIYGGEEEKDAQKVALQGVGKFKKENYETIILDTAGRHKDEENLIIEMREIAEGVKPDEIVLVVDATIGQQATVQAESFHKNTKIGSIILTKIDGSGRGGGALSAVASIDVPIKFIGVGEKIDDFNVFVPSRFVGRLLGMGDIEGLIQRVRDAEVRLTEKDAKAILKGKFTLEDMYTQMETMKGLGSLSNILKMVPGMSLRLKDKSLDDAEDKLRRWGYVIQSMTKDEKNDPKILNASRINRIARGSGTDKKDVKELISRYNAMKKMMKSFGKRRVPQVFRRMFRQIS